MFMKSIIGAAVLTVGISMASAADISGAGATFPFPKPDLAIVPIHRVGGSGTTFNFTDYLAEV